jgi:hypothetical protein
MEDFNYLDFLKVKTMKKLLVLFILIPSLTLAQWNYNNVSSGTSRYATGEINFIGKDEFKLIKSRSLDLIFSISSDYFKKNPVTIMLY